MTDQNDELLAPPDPATIDRSQSPPLFSSYGDLYARTAVYRQQRGARRLAFGLIGGVIGFTALVAIGAVISASMHSPTSAHLAASSNDSSTATHGAFATETYPNMSEVVWKSGSTWIEPPASVEASRFTSAFATPAEFLTSIGRLPRGFSVVVTDDTAVNCGWTSQSAAENDFGGCYRPEYGNTIFVYWAPHTPSRLKELLVLHELSHFYQQWNHYDDISSADTSDVPRPQLESAIETDATCRVYVEWGYEKYRDLDDQLSASCDSTNWSSSWLHERLGTLGVTVTDR